MNETALGNRGAGTEGQLFGAECLVAQCCKKGKTAFSALHIPDMEEVTELNARKRSFSNIEYALPNGQIVKF
ncbi:hypothetical protein [Acutalibacter intestini]|uniref:hypothetical protein n=1 Tax=Acutalibacter intestini TaxID=3093659 RepID=UPI002AC9D8FD|nr:hypothetical protein [Acutalibacter sp. M00204]